MRKPEPQMTGSHFIFLGLGLCAIALLIIAISGGEPTYGRAETLMLFGIPGGIVCIVIGIVMKIRKHRR